MVGGAKRRACLWLRGLHRRSRVSSAGGITTIKVTYYDVVGPDGQLAAFEAFTLRRPRNDYATNPFIGFTGALSGNTFAASTRSARPR